MRLRWKGGQDQTLEFVGTLKDYGRKKFYNFWPLILFSSERTEASCFHRPIKKTFLALSFSLIVILRDAEMCHGVALIMQGGLITKASADLQLKA